MKHRYYDFCLKFDSEAHALKAQQFYEKQHKPRVGGKFEIQKPGICIWSVRDECELVTDFYQFGLQRFMVADDEHGYKKSNNGYVYEFLTELGDLCSFTYDENICNAMYDFLQNKIVQAEYVYHENDLPPIIKKFQEAVGYDDLYDILDVSVPGFDV